MAQFVNGIEIESFDWYRGGVATYTGWVDSLAYQVSIQFPSHEEISWTRLKPKNTKGFLNFSQKPSRQQEIATARKAQWS
jgi:hypothetical protein